jgi:ATP-dependent DNA ligase
MIYFFPNRPLLTSIESEQIKSISQNSKWTYEIKKNGERLCLYNQNGFKFWNRHKSILKYVPSKEIVEQLNSFNIPNFTHIDAELIHNRTKHIKNQIYIYDIYILDGQQMSGTLQERREILKNIFNKKVPNVYLADIYNSNTIFENWKTIIEKEENEGVVFKNIDGKITWNAIKSPDVWWQIKCRKQAKNYKF